MWSLPPFFAKTLLLNCAVVRTPLDPTYQRITSHTSGDCSQDVAVDDLSHGDMATVGDDVERLGLNIGAAHDLPCQIVLREFGVRRVLGLLGDRVHALGAIVVISKTDAMHTMYISR